MNRATFVLPVLTLIVGTLLPTGKSLAPQSIKQAVPIRNGWGVALELEKPFHNMGDELSAAYSVTNFSAQDTYGFSPTRGGNGCTYRMTIEDPAGNIVWEPGSIINGMFDGPGCAFAMTFFDFSSGTQFKRSTVLPLIYQNGHGNGILGDPLPPGFYRVRVSVFAAGPQTELLGLEPGLVPTSSVPFRIRP